MKDKFHMFPKPYCKRYVLTIRTSFGDFNKTPDQMIISSIGAKAVCVYEWVNIGQRKLPNEMTVSSQLHYIKVLMYKKINRQALVEWIIV